MSASKSEIEQVFFPDWNLPKGVRSCFTYRRGGISEKPYSSFNLGSNVGDNPSNVHRNRALLKRTCDLRIEPLWLTQVHGNKVIDSCEYQASVEADACITSTPGLACVITVADCLPVLLSDIFGNQVAAVHAGWRGIEKNILSDAVRCFKAAPSEIKAWIGPSISRNKYKVGEALRKRFQSLPSFSEEDFDKNGSGFLFDLKSYAFRELKRCGVREIRLDRRCVHEEKQLFYSYRRDGQSGRMAALIWKT